MEPVGVALAGSVADWISGSLGSVALVMGVLAAIFLAFAVLSYVLIAHFDVAPRVTFGRKGFRLRFERLPPPR